MAALLRDSNGVSLVANSLRLNGGTIQATDDSANATLTHAAMAFPGHKVAAGGEFLLWGWRRSASRSWRLSTTGTQAPATRHGSGSVRPPRPAPTATSPQQRGARRALYTPSAGDLGRWLKATVTYDDTNGTGWTAEATQQEVLSRPTLSNAGYAHNQLIGYIYDAPVTHRYAQPFTTGSHTRGYLLTEVRLALFWGRNDVGNRRPGRGRCMPTTPASRRPRRFRLLSQS